MNNKVCKLIMLILPVTLSFTGCMGTGEIEDPAAFKVPSVTLNEASMSKNTIKVAISATYGSTGKNTKVSKCGFYYSKNSDLSNADKVDCTADSDRKFTTDLTIKEYGAEYFFRAYISDGRNEILSDTKSFTIGSFESYIEIGDVICNPISKTSMKATCTISSAEGISLSEKGICYGTEPDLSILSEHKSVGSGDSTIEIDVTNLSVGVQYYVCGYAKESGNIKYGNVIQFSLYSAPAVKTAEITSVTATSANCGGFDIVDYGKEVSGKGVVWSKGQNPTVSLETKTSNGAGNGSFTSIMNGLEPGTTYYVRAYATNSEGTGYGEEKSFTTDATLAELSTTSVSNVTSNSATVSGSISSTGGDAVTERGIVYATHENPTTSDGKVSSGTGLGTFSASITDLARATTYYARAYAVNSKGTTYGNQLTFTTTAEAPEVSTTAVSSITPTSATTGGNVLSDGGAEVTVRGVVYGTSSSPTVSLSTKTADGSGTGVFTSYLSELLPGTKYFVRAYATNDIATVYGNEESFTTEVGMATVATSAASSITETTAVLGGEVISGGGLEVTERGVIWGGSNQPTMDNSTKEPSGAGVGTFSCNVSGLVSGLTYYYRAYAVNSAGTVYGDIQSFKTPWQFEAVDLGLSVKWANCNLGANSQEGPGDYYAWGELEPYYEDGQAQEENPVWKAGKSDGYIWTSYRFFVSGHEDWGEWQDLKLSKYVTNSSYGTVDNKTVLDPEDDAAHVKLGGNWRMPTKEEWEELRSSSNCIWKPFTHDNYYKVLRGYIVTSKINGNSIYLPFNEVRTKCHITQDEYFFAYYWTSELQSSPYPEAFLFNYSGGTPQIATYSCCAGLGIRPVAN